ncbi:FG-GAP repeat domain protein [Verrucomicrobiia bacterium DG1235]|nr:FG-GAP repeat domain protein [Verrucomicrobiae bacterium DG1235]
MPNQLLKLTATLTLSLFTLHPSLFSSTPLNPQNPEPNTQNPAPLFTLLDPAKTGIEFTNTYDDPFMWGRRYREFTLGAVGTGIATGDFDRDGRPDIYAVSKTGPNKLFRQTAPFQFEDVTETAGVAGLTDAWATGITFVDINNDGWLDLYLCQFDAPNQLFINQQDGTFAEEAASYGLAIVDASVMASFADIDRDGDLDLYLQTNILDYNENFKGRPDYLFRNNGDNTFTDITAEAGIWGISQGHSATWWDYDHDGWPDLYVANDFENSDRLYRNNGDATFTDVLSDTIPHTSYFSMGSDLGDIDNDGLTDFFVGDMAATTHEKDMRGMAEMGRGIWENERVDSLFPMYMRNAFYLNNGTERFNEIAYLNRLDASDWTWSVKFADLDNNGWTDLFITNGNIRNFMEADLLDKQSVAASLIARIRVYKNAPPFKEKNLAFRNEGDLSFTNVSEDWGLDYLGVSFGTSYCDLDRDGDLDLIVSNLEENIHVYRNNSQNPGFLVRLQGVSSNQYGIGATAYYQSPTGTQTRQLTLAHGVLSSDEPLLHFAPGSTPASRSAGPNQKKPQAVPPSSQFTTHSSLLTIHWPSGQTSTLDNPQPGQLYTLTEPEGPAKNPEPKTQNPEAYKASSQFTEVSTELGLNYSHEEDYYNELTDQLLLPRRLSKQGPALAYDASNKTLHISGNAKQATTSISLRPSSSQPNTQHPSPSTQSDILGILALDNTILVGSDLAPRSTQPDKNLSAAGHLSGEAALTNPPIPATSILTAGDFDSDGDLDLFIGGRSISGKYPETPHSYLLENRNGSYIDVTEERAPGLATIGMVTSAIWSDATGDNKPDLLLTLDWGSVTLFTNQNGTLVNTTANSGLAPYLGWWNSIISADFNGDGRLDYAVGNAGLNTKYLASPERPTYLYYGDFDGSGKKQILEAQYEDGDDRLYPIRPYSKLRYAFPSLGEKFNTFTAFAQATLPEIFEPARLDSATRLEANTLASGIFLNQGQGTFRFHELPRLAQIAPTYGMAAQDFDGDGFTDLYLAQNSFSPEPTTGRFNGGLSLLLHGNGDGTFTPVKTATSGLMVRGDAKSAITLDLQDDGWADLIVAQNSDKLLAFQNRGIEGNHSFAVSLEYLETNPHAYGAKVTVHRTDGSQTTAELTSTAGYLSQSEPKLFFGYTDKNTPTKIEVTWPDEKTTKHPFSSESPTLHIAISSL